MLKVSVFSSSTEMVKFSSDESLVQANIVQIVQNSGTWYLFYWR